MKTRRPRYIDIDLPSLTGEQACWLAMWLEHALCELWRVHADAMADYSDMQAEQDIEWDGEIFEGDAEDEDNVF